MNDERTNEHDTPLPPPGDLDEGDADGDFAEDDFPDYEPPNCYVPGFGWRVI